MTTREGGLTRRAVGNMAWVAWGSGATALLKVVVLVVLTRLLAPADFGLVSAALVGVAVGALSTYLVSDKRQDPNTSAAPTAAEPTTARCRSHARPISR